MMQWAVAFMLVLTHVLGVKRRNIMEEAQTKTTLHILDDTIVECLTKPTVETSRLLSDEIAKYNSQFIEIIDGFKDRKFRFVRIAHVIYEKGGPNFMKLRLDAPMFLKVNGWTMNELGELYHRLKATHSLWLQFKALYEEVKTAVKGNWTQLRSIYHCTDIPNINITLMQQDIIVDTTEHTVPVTNSTDMGEAIKN